MGALEVERTQSAQVIQGAGNCLFRAFYYAITGAIIHYMKTTDECMRLLAGHIDDVTINNYLQRTRIDEEGTWGSQTEMYLLAHMTGLNLFSFNTQARMYAYILPGHIDQERGPDTSSHIYSVHWKPLQCDPLTGFSVVAIMQ